MLQPVPLPQLRSLPTLLLPPPSADDGNADVNLNEQHPVLQQPPMQLPLNADGQMCMEGGIQAFGSTWPDADMDMLGPSTCSSAGGSAEGLHPVITTGPGFGLVPLPFAPREGGPGSCGWSGGVSHRLGPRGVGISRHRHTQSADVSSLSLAHFGMLGSPAV